MSRIFYAACAILLISARVSADVSPSAVVKTRADRLVGAFAGYSAAYSVAGDYQSVILVLSKTGYAMPLMASGEAATFPLMYFEKPECKGKIYLPMAQPVGGLQPMGGLVVKSLHDNSLIAIARFEQPKQIVAKSVIDVAKTGKSRCISISQELKAFLVVANDPAVTAFSDFSPEPVAVSMASITDDAGEKSRARRGGIGSFLGARENHVSDKAHAEKSRAEKPDDEPIAECSTGCPVEALGNKVCDEVCYVDACSFDNGDCDQLDKKEREKIVADMCSPGCFSRDQGDGFCDSACNVAACEFDKGDCGAPDKSPQDE